ncbi:S9 family peptidase [Herbiconiux sp. KACC 21604]|uniref:S9 family peptidase n=1 Tax=unclassified Herbiconiux TaxID=2618217 RepID=UPI0014930B5A|nr:S9 family peptidase [Herbiconiux sp. SALV-R1]QJU53741.1 S9 family peptidase [Herbiconiux sp. SALV-R1]WPO84745.1 S9 family peptidase [Herbiconiux sp. KACC 21604]
MASVPPRAPRVPTERVHHGDVVIDAFEWLRDKDDPEVIAYLEAENAYTEEQTAHLDALRGKLFDEIKSRTLETDLSVPVRDGDHWYYTRTIEGSQYGVHCRAAVAGPGDWTPPKLVAGEPVPGEQIVLDDNVEAEGHDFFSLGSFDVSPDGNLLAYAVDVVGDERYTLRIRDLRTGENLPDEVGNTFPGAVFSGDGESVFYPTVDDAWRPDTIWRHRLGTDAADDEKVFTEPDDRYWVGIGLTRSKRYLEIALGSKITSEVHLLDTTEADASFEVVWPRREGVEYSVEHAVVGGEDRLLILHNDGALNFELISVAPDAPLDRSRWEVVRAHDPAVRLEDVDAFANHLTLDSRRDGLTRVSVLQLGADVTSLENAPFAELEFGEPLFSVGTSGNPEWQQPTIRYGFGSFVTPSSVFDYDIASGTSTLLKQAPVLGGYDPARYEQRRDWATAADGTRVPISLVAARGVFDSGAPAPLVLYGYGSYEASIDPSFSISRLSLLDRGVVFAIAHVRGGGEMGRQWYEEGKTLTKKNTFTDFVACASHLVASGVTSPERLVAQGGSAGGLLMGAVANLAPELFAGVLAQVPFVDALTSILDPELPLTVIEWDEWGDPLHDPEVYFYMKEYSPYENVTEQRYPRILAVTSLNDTRVLYVEPAKWTARLREVDAPVLLKTEMSAGHGGVSGRYERWREVSYESAWILDVLGLAD